MKTRTVVLTLGIVLTSAFLILASCKKINDSTTLGGGLIPPIDNIHTFETFLDVETDNFILGDSTRIGYYDNMAIGVLNDPVFGTTKGEAYFTIQAPFYGAYPFINRDSVEIDSIILTAAYSEIYGDTNSIQSLQVFEISQSANFDSVGNFYPISNPDFALAGSLSPVTAVSFNKLNDELRIKKGKDTVIIQNQLRLRLDTSVLNSRFKNYDTSANGAYKNDSIFRANFKGMAIKVVGGDEKALTYINFSNSDLSGLEFYVRYRLYGVWDTTVVKFGVNSRIAANLVKRNHSAEFLNNMGTPPPTANKEKLYIQSSPGSYASVRVKGLDTLKNNIINRAELVIHAVPSQGDNYIQKPRVMFCDAIDSNRNIFRTIPIDFLIEQGTYSADAFGGIFKSEKTFFNMTRYVQGIVTRKDSIYSFRIYAPYSTNPRLSLGGTTETYYPFGFALYVNSPISYGRVVVGGGNHPDPSKRMKMRIVYTKI